MRQATPLVIFLLLFVGEMVAPDAGRAEHPALRLATTVWPPFTDVDGKPHVAVDLVHEALRRAGVDASSAIVADGTLIEALDAGSFDGSAALWRSPERERFLLYSRPYLDNRIVLVGRKGSDVNVSSLSELEGQRVAIVGWYAYGPAVDEVEGPLFSPGRDDPTNLQRLLDGEVDYVLADELVMRHVFDRYPDEARERLETGTRAVARRTLHLALRADHAGAEEIIAAFDAQIPAMLADGSYNRILGLTWVRTDVDGDGRVELVATREAAERVAPSAPFDVLVPETAAGGRDAPARYVVDGQTYTEWEVAPERDGKAPPERERSGRDGLILLRF